MLCAERQHLGAEAAQPQAGVPGAAAVSALALPELHTLLFETAMLVADDLQCVADREVSLARTLTRRAARAMAAARKNFRGGWPPHGANGRLRA